MLQHLALRDFRNFERLEVAVPSGGLVIVGDNGQGKTNLLESISYLALFRSVRGARDSDAIRFGAPAFHIRAELTAPSAVTSVSVGYERAGKRKKATLDGVEQSRLSTALGALPSVCFSPVDVALVAGGPAERRHFLDVTLALSVPRYLHALQQYRGALRQRNAALRAAQRAGARTSGARTSGARTNGEHEANVAVWEPSLARHGAVLATIRNAWCSERADEFTNTCAAIGEKSTVLLRYAGADVGASAGAGAGAGADEGAAGAGAEYAIAYEQQRAHEIRRGTTLVGPHRDDLQLLLGNRDLRTFGSAGQQRTAAIALRVLELGTLRESTGATPLLLLDDPFAELDAKRSARILTLLEQGGVDQLILAVPREQDIPAAFTRLDRRSMIGGELR